MGKSSDFFFLYFCIITLLPTNIQIKFHLKHRKFQKTVSERVKFDKWSDKHLVVDILNVFLCFN